MKIDRVYHYTSLENLEKIKSDGILKPLTFDKCKRLLSLEHEKRFKAEYYLLSIFTQTAEEYDCEWREKLCDYTSGEVVIEVPVKNLETVFVRDNNPQPEIDDDKLREKYGYSEFHYKSMRQVIIDSETENAYVESTISLLDYEGGFNAPEIWLPQETPLCELKINIVDFV
jgi:hypothetical protein